MKFLGAKVQKGDSSVQRGLELKYTRSFPQNICRYLVIGSIPHHLQSASAAVGRHFVNDGFMEQHISGPPTPNSAQK